MENSGRKITKIAWETNRLVLQVMKKNGIGTGEMDLIHLVRHNPGISQKEACEALNADKAAITRRVLSLEKKGYLIRKTDETDHRKHLLYPTDQAERLRNSKSEIESVFYSWLLENLSEEERTQFLSTLDQIYLRSKKESREGFPDIRKRIRL